MELRLCPVCRRVCPGEVSCPHCGATLSIVGPDFFVGKSFGKYRLRSVLGAGGMGVVYLAEQETLARHVALKMVVPERQDAGYQERFLREGRILAGLHHPNIVEIYDFDVNEWGLPFAVMEYLEGTTLREHLNANGPLHPAEVVAILEEIGAGLSAAHDAGVVHRDLKPGNIFLARFHESRVTKILDFGIAKTVGDQEMESGLTRTGMIVGTLNYLAPEQLLGGEITPATDQFALALVVVELLTGKAARSGKTLSRIIAEETGALPRSHCLPGEFPTLAPVIEKATDPVKERRFPDVNSFVQAVARCLELLPNPEEAVPTLVLQEERTLPSHRENAEERLGERISTRRRIPFLPRFRTIAAAAVFGGMFILGGVALHHWKNLPDSGPTTLLRLEREFPVAVDAGRILVVEKDRLSLAGLNGVILQPLSPGGVPARVSINPEDVLGSTPDGSLIIRNGSRLSLWKSEATSRVDWADGLPENARGISSPDCAFFVSSSDRLLTVWHLDHPHYRRAFQASLPFEPRVLTVGKRLLALAGREELQVWSLRTGRKLLETQLPDGPIKAVAVDDLADRVAVAGWFDTIMVFNVNGGSLQRIPRRQGAMQQVSLLYLNGALGPVLAVGEDNGLSLWSSSGEMVARWDRGGSRITDLREVAGRLVALDTAEHKVLVFSLGGLSSRKVLRYAHDNAWAAVVDAASSRVFLGNESGTLYAVSVDTGKVEQRVVHTEGITSLVSDGHRLASASDDRTIAVWRLPDLSLEWRSRAHGFLVNQLVLLPERHVLWSSSSDGLVKRWSWPDLNELATIDTRRLTGERLSLHAIWVAPDEHKIVLGTWNHLLLVLTREEDGTWSVKKMAFEARAGYAIAELKAFNSLAVLGIGESPRVVLYDLTHDSFSPLRIPEGLYPSQLSLEGGRRLLVFGDHKILDYRFRKERDGELRYRLTVVRHDTLDASSAAALLPDGSVAVADTTGSLHIIPLREIHGLSLCDVPVSRSDRGEAEKRGKDACGRRPHSSAGAPGPKASGTPGNRMIEGRHRPQLAGPLREDLGLLPRDLMWSRLPFQGHERPLAGVEGFRLAGSTKKPA